MRWERKGSAREVFLIGRWAIKVPRVHSWETFLWGLLSNIQEAEFGRCGWPELCPVVWRIRGGFMVVMPRVQILTEAEFDEGEIGGIVDAANAAGRCVPAEFKPDSWGRLDGRIVAVDYG